MNKRLLITILSIAIATLLMIPSVALQYVTVDEFKEITEEHTAECHGDVCTHTNERYLAVGKGRSGPLPLLEQPMLLLQEQLPAMLRRLNCTHENLIAYHDTDLNETSQRCANCAQTWVDESPVIRSSAIMTSSVIREACAHEYAEEPFLLNENYHIYVCGKCNHYLPEPHTIVPADCVNNERCSVCYDRYPTWDLAWGHLMDFVSDNDWTAPYTHTYRCTRRDNDMQYKCDYIAYEDDCSMVLYWDPAENGYHFFYEICETCMGFGNFSEEPCSAYSGACYQCNHPNEWEP